MFDGSNHFTSIVLAKVLAFILNGGMNDKSYSLSDVDSDELLIY